MFEHLKKLITTHDLSALFSFCSNLADNERLALLEEFRQSKWGLKKSFWDKGMFELQPPNDSDYEFIMALFLLTRSVEEYQTLSIHKICGYYVSSSHFFNNSKALHILPKILREEKYRFILDFYRALKPNEKEFLSFETYWTLYKAGEIPFDEALFTKNITATYLYDDKKVRYTDLVLHDQEFHDKIFRRLHLYENQMFHDAKPWEDFFVHLQRQGYVFDRKYIPELLESLLNPWKKPHLNWHCRWVEFLEPTTDELLVCQQTLFALLSTGNTNLINFALKHIQQIASEKAFDFQAFTDNFALCFTTQKIAKSQLIGLHILEKHYQKQAPTNPDYGEQLAVLFTVPDTKLQEKVATLLTSYFSGEGLAEVVTPYQDYLKGKSQELLATLSPTPIQNDNLSSQLTDCSPSEKSVRVGYVTELRQTRVLRALFNEEPGVVLQTTRANRDRLLGLLRAHGLSVHSHVIGTPNDQDTIEVHNDGKCLFSLPRTTLQQAWAETSHRIASLRDDPACTAESFALEGAAQDEPPHLSVRLPATSIEAWRNMPAAPAVVGQRPRVAILREQGVNSQREMAAAFDLAGFEAYDVHMSDLIAGRHDLAQFQALVACGGFSYGDVLGAGAGWARTILFNPQLSDAFGAFFARPDTLTLGVCNGCQMLSHLKGLIPGAEGWPRFVRNRSEQYEGRFASVEILSSPSLWLSGMAGDRLPIVVSHGEGRADFSDVKAQGADGTLSAEALTARIAAANPALQYIDGRGNATETYPLNPNGSPRGVTGFASADGRATIMMPHPERVFRLAQWSWKPRALQESGLDHSPWMRLWHNARRQFQ